MKRFLGSCGSCANVWDPCRFLHPEADRAVTLKTSWRFPPHDRAGSKHSVRPSRNAGISTECLICNDRFINTLTQVLLHEALHSDNRRFEH